MQKRLADTAQIVMDLYLQNYRTDEDFFNLEHFKYLCGVVFYKLLEDDYKLQRKESFQEHGFTEITLPSNMLIEEVVKVKYDNDTEFYIGETKHPVIIFPYDAIANGIQSIFNNIKGGCKEFIRESYKRRWALCDLPVTSNVYWFGEGGKIYFKATANCKLEKLKVRYASDPSDESFGEDGGMIDQTKEKAIIDGVWEMMVKAKNGVVVDMTNNGNPNKRIQSEIDTGLTDSLSTKPIA